MATSADPVPEEGSGRHYRCCVVTPRIAEQIGRVLGGRYRLVAPIGTGASAHVYVAEDARLRRRVAVKVLHPALAGDESFLRRFRAEAQAVAGLRHPHIMNVYDWGEDDDGPFLVLEHFSGGSLRDVLDRGHRLSLSQALVVGLEAARGLEHAHRRGLVHRDIKPANLLFDDEGRLSIADFGLARALAEAAWTEPAGAVLGTARYASPEQAKGSSVDGKSDVYALALSIIESVTGQVPFAADTTIATLMARVDRPLEPPAALGPLGPVLAAAGAPNPLDRIDAAEFARQLEVVARDLPRPDPLPVSVSAPPSIDLTDHDARDLTTIGVPVPTNGLSSTNDTRAPSSRLFDADREPVPMSEGDPTAVRPRRRRRLKLLVALVIVAGLAAGAVAFAGATKPSFAVADLRGKTVADARRLVSGEADFTVTEQSGTFHSEDVPAGRIIIQAPLPAERRKQGSGIRVQVSDGPKPRVVPDLAAKSRADAQKALADLQLVFAAKDEFSETVPKDTVIDWSPKGQPVDRDSTVTVVISKGKQPKPIPPSLIDQLYDKAAKALEDLGFLPKKEEAFNDKVAEGAVVTTRPAPNETLEPGNEVIVVVSKGPERVAVPDVSGKSIEDAVSILQSAGFEVGGPYGPPNARRAYSTSPGAGNKVKKGSLVDLLVGR